MKKLLFFSVCFLCVYSCDKKKEYSPEIEAQAQHMVDSMMVAAKKPNQNAIHWQYSVTEDKMGETTKLAEVQSPDILEFSSPYSGGSISTLVVRKSNSGTDIFYTISNGQIVSASVVDGGNVRVKFDDKKPEFIDANMASDGSSDIIFLHPEEELLKDIRGAKKMVLEVEFYQNGIKQIEFDVSGLKDF